MKSDIEHPAAEELVAYALGELAQEEESRLRRHLEGCQECRDMAHDLAAFPDLEPPDDSYGVSEEELRETRGKLRLRFLGTRAEGPEVKPRVLTFSPPEPARTPRPSLAVWFAVAAALVLVFGWGLSAHLEVGRLQERVNDLDGRLKTASEGWKNIHPITLLREDNSLRSTEERELTLEDSLLLVMDLDEAPPSPLTAEVRTLAGDTVFRVEGLKPWKGVLTFGLRPGDVEPGEYRVFLVDRDGKELPVSFEFRLAE